MVLIILSLLAVLIGTCRSRCTPKETQAEPFDFRHFSIQFFGVCLYTAVWAWYGYQGKNPIFAANNQVNEALAEAQPTAPEEHAIYQWTYSMLYAFVIAHITIWVQLCHVSKQKYQPFIKIFVFNLIAMGVVGIAATQNEDIDTRMTMLGVLAITVLFQWIFIFTSIYEITSTLGISVFKTK
jgi:hypothetical protein